MPLEALLASLAFTVSRISHDQDYRTSSFLRLICADSLKHLRLAEATVITFLTPMTANFACSILFGQEFPKRELLSGMVSLVGVVFIARTFSLDSDREFALKGPLASRSLPVFS